MKRQSVKSRIGKIVIYSLLVILAIQSLYPILWIIMSSLNPGDSLVSSKMIPAQLTTEHYVDLFTEKDFGMWYLNTFKISFFTMIFSLIFVTCTAYALSQFRFKGRRTGLMSILVLQAFPAVLSMVSIYILLYYVGLLNTHFGLILIYIGGLIPGTTWFVKGFFDSISRSLPEAAKIDGASNLVIFFKIMLPLSIPALTFVALLSFMTPWMDYAIARLVLTSGANQTVALGLYNMVQRNSHTEFTMFAAGSVIIAIPLTALYSFLQKYLIHGLSEGAAKF